MHGGNGGRGQEEARFVDLELNQGTGLANVLMGQVVRINVAVAAAQSLKQSIRLHV